MKDLEKKTICDEAIGLKKSLETQFLALGEHLLRIKTELLYEPHFGSWGAFLDEMKISESQASRLMGIYQRFVVDYGFAPGQLAEAGGWTTVARLLPVATTKKKAEKYLHLAKELTRADLEKELREERTGTEERACAHKRSYVIKICPDCGLKERVYEE